MTPLSPRAPLHLSVGAALWLTSVAIVLGAALLAAVGALWAGATGVSVSEGMAQAQASVPALTAVQAVAMGTAIALGLRGADRPLGPRQVLPLEPVWPASLCLLFVGGCALQLPLSELSNLLYAHVFEPMSLEEQRALARALTPDGAAARVAVLISLAVIVPIFEELLFRGVILHGLLPGQGRAGAVVLSAALFGLCHVRPAPVVYAFCAGLALGVVALRAGSVHASIALHAGVNALPILFGTRRWKLPGFNVPSADVVHLPLPLVFGALGVSGVLVWAALRLHQRRRLS